MAAVVVAHLTEVVMLVEEEPDLEILLQVLLFSLIMLVVVMEEMVLLRMLLLHQYVSKDQIKDVDGMEKLIPVVVEEEELMLQLMQRQGI